MKALIFSDTHGKINSAIKIIEQHKQVDVIIHLGDLIKDARDIQSIFKDIKVEFIAGNNDLFSNVPNEKTINLGTKKVFIAHGHTYRVKYGLDEIIKKGNELGADGVLFGHTHCTYENIIENALYLNPGSLTFPCRGPSYGLIEVIDNKMYSMICNV